VENTSMNVTRWELVLDYLMLVPRRERVIMLLLLLLLLLFLLLFLLLLLSLSLAGRPRKLAAAENVHVKMEDRLTTVRPVIHHDTISVF